MASEITHADKLRFNNELVAFARRMKECADANIKACELIDEEVKDLTEEKMKEVLNRIRRWDDAHDMEVEAWLQRFFS